MKILRAYVGSWIRTLNCCGTLGKGYLWMCKDLSPSISQGGGWGSDCLLLWFTFSPRAKSHFHIDGKNQSRVKHTLTLASVCPSVTYCIMCCATVLACCRTWWVNDEWRMTPLKLPEPRVLSTLSFVEALVWDTCLPAAWHAPPTAIRDFGDSDHAPDQSQRMQAEKRERRRARRHASVATPS